MSVDIVHMVLAAIEVQQLRAGDADVTLVIELGPDLPLVVANAERLREDLEHLLVHAIDRGGAGRVTIRVERDGDWIQISVDDDRLRLPVAPLS